MRVYHPYPKWKYHATKEAVIVGSEDAEASLGAGWFDTPAGFCKSECEASHDVSAPPVPVKKPGKRAKQ